MTRELENVVERGRAARMPWHTAMIDHQAQPRESGDVSRQMVRLAVHCDERRQTGILRQREKIVVSTGGESIDFRQWHHPQRAGARRRCDQRYQALQVRIPAVDLYEVGKPIRMQERGLLREGIDPPPPSPGSS
jgi:hypothetical protein